MSFDPKTDEPADDSRAEKNIKKMYEKLLSRGNTEQAEHLRNLDTIGGQVNYIGGSVVEFDPKHDDTLNTSAKIAVKHVYEGLLELGYEERAEELRMYKTTSSQSQFAKSLAEEVDGEIDLISGEVTHPETADEPAANAEAAAE